MDKAFAFLESSFEPVSEFSFGDSGPLPTDSFSSSKMREIRLEDGTTLSHRTYRSPENSVDCGIWLDGEREDHFGDHFWSKTDGQSKFLLELELDVAQGSDFSIVTVCYYDKGFVFFDNAKDENLIGFHGALYDPSLVALYSHVGSYLRKPEDRELGQDYSDFINASGTDPTSDDIAKFFGVG